MPYILSIGTVITYQFFVLSYLLLKIVNILLLNVIQYTYSVYS